MPDSQQRQMKAWVIGLDMFYATAGMLLVGALIDHFAGTRPWWMLGLGLVGLGVGMVRFIADAARLNRESQPAGSASRAVEGAGRGTEGSDPSGPPVEVPHHPASPDSSPGGQNPAKP
jgi:MFS family permease